MEDFCNAINDKETSDVAFRIETPSATAGGEPEKEKGADNESASSLIYAHKAVLMYRCEYFRNMFRSGMMESSADVLSVTYADRDTFLAVLEFIYTDDVTGSARRKALAGPKEDQPESKKEAEEPKKEDTTTTPQPEKFITKTKRDLIDAEKVVKTDEDIDITIEMGVVLIELADLFELPLLKEVCEKRLLSKVR